MRIRNYLRDRYRAKLLDMRDDKNRPERATGHLNIRELSEEEIDHNLMETFPASDPPSWTLGVERDKQPVNGEPE
jgi:hypothetical protein